MTIIFTIITTLCQNGHKMSWKIGKKGDCGIFAVVELVQEMSWQMRFNLGILCCREEVLAGDFVFCYNII